MRVKGILKIVLLVLAAVLIVALPIILVVGVWIYLVWMAWKKKTKIFHDQMEPQLAERRLKMLETLLLLAGISLLGCIVGFILFFAIYGPSPSEEDEPILFLIMIPTLVLFTAATIGSSVIFIKGRRKQNNGITK